MAKISVALPVYNGALYLKEALDSILAQDFSDFELIVSDGGSTDETPGILAEYQQRDRRLQVYRSETHVSMGENFNLAISFCKGEWVQLFCHDDIMLPGCLARLDTVIEQLTDDRIGFIGHGQAWLFANGCYYNPSEDVSQIRNWQGTSTFRGYALSELKAPRVWNGPAYLRSYMRGYKVDNIPDVTSAVVRKEAFNTTTGFDKTFLLCDMFFWLRMLMSWDYLVIPEALAVIRIHPNQTTVQLRKTNKAIQELQVFWPSFLREARRELQLDNRAYVRAAMKPLALAGNRIALELMKRKFKTASRLTLNLPLSWWPVMPLFIVRGIRVQSRWAAQYRGAIPLEVMHP